MELSTPLITCICVTNNRSNFIKGAINCFSKQDYSNKELLISYPKQDLLSRRIIDNVVLTNDLKIFKLERENTLTLGEARNQAIDQASGEYVCIWDDDDWHHPSRLSYQYNGLRHSAIYSACIISQLLLYDQVNDKAYLSFRYPWEGTLLCRKSIFVKNQYSNENKGEDSIIIDKLEADRFLCHLDNVSFLYIYIYHGKNTWNYQHFDSLIKRSQLLNKALTQTIQHQIE